MLLEGKVAVVTGAGRGIGRAVALDLARAGARVVVNDYGVAVDGSEPSEGPAQDVVDEIKRGGGDAVAVFETVTTMEGGERIIKTALDQFGKLDILVCVAGILRERMIFNMPEDDWDAVIATHLKGHFACMKPATIVMRQQRSGRIITFTSSAGLDGSPGQPNYSAAKEGIVGLTRSTARTSTAASSTSSTSTRHRTSSRRSRPAAGPVPSRSSSSSRRPTRGSLTRSTTASGGTSSSSHERSSRTSRCTASCGLRTRATTTRTAAPSGRRTVTGSPPGAAGRWAG